MSIHNEVSRMFSAYLSDLTPECEEFIKLIELVDYDSLKSITYRHAREAGAAILGDRIQVSDDPITPDEVKPYMEEDAAFPYLALVTLVDDLSPEIQLLFLEHPRYFKILGYRSIQPETILKFLEKHKDDEDFLKKRAAFFEVVFFRIEDSEQVEKAEKLFLSSNSLQLLESLITSSSNSDSVKEAISKAEQLSPDGQTYYDMAFLNRDISEELLAELWGRVLQDYTAKPAAYRMSLDNAANLIKFRSVLSAEFLKQAVKDAVKLTLETEGRGQDSLAVLGNRNVNLYDEEISELISLLISDNLFGLSDEKKISSIAGEVLLELGRTKTLPPPIEQALARSMLSSSTLSHFIANNKLSPEASVIALRSATPSQDSRIFTGMPYLSECQDEIAFLCIALTGSDKMLRHYSHEDSLLRLARFAFGDDVMLDGLPADYLKRLIMVRAEQYSEQLEQERTGSTPESALFHNFLKAEGKDTKSVEWFTSMMQELPPLYARELAIHPSFPEALHDAALYSSDVEVSSWFASAGKLTLEHMRDYFERFLEGADNTHEKTAGRLVSRLLRQESEIDEEVRELISRMMSYGAVVTAVLENTADEDLVIDALKKVIESSGTLLISPVSLIRRMSDYSNETIEFLHRNLKNFNLKEKDVQDVLHMIYVMSRYSEEKITEILTEIAENFKDDYSIVWGVPTKLSDWASLVNTSFFSYKANEGNIKTIISKSKYPNFIANMFMVLPLNETPVSLIKEACEIKPDENSHPQHIDFLMDFGMSLYSNVLDSLAWSGKLPAELWDEYVSEKNLKRSSADAMVAFTNLVHDSNSFYSIAIAKELLRRGKLDKILWKKRHDMVEQLNYTVRGLYHEKYGKKVDFIRLSDLIRLIELDPGPIINK